MPLLNSSHDVMGQRKLTVVRGEYVAHIPMMPCSCRGGPEFDPKPTCRVCGGSGRAYGSVTTMRGLVAGISNQDKVLLQAGLAMPGDMTFSPDVAPTIQVYDYDVIRLSYPLPYEGDVVKRGEDRLQYVAARVLQIQSHDPQTGATTTYSSDQYTLSGKRVIWVSGEGPSLGTSYAVRYDAIYDWVVYPGVTLPRIDRGTALGQRVLLRKRHLAGVPVILTEATDSYLIDADGSMLIDADSQVLNSP